MKQAALGVFLFLLLSFPVLAEPLQASIKKTWTVETAREEAFLGAEPYLDISSYPRIDPDLVENGMAIFNEQEIVGKRHLTIFDGDSYAVAEYCSPKTFYYDDSSQLYAVGISNYYSYSGVDCQTQESPRKQYKYAYPGGALLRVSISVKANDSYVFNPDGSLSAHWVGNKCFWVNGSSCGARMSYKE